MKKYQFIPNLITVFILQLILINGVSAQISFEFAKPIPVEQESIKNVNALYYGIYESKKGAHLNYEFNDNGIFINTINIQAISKETLRESPKYFIRNEHIFGVTEDSIPYVYQDENYYFGVRNTIAVIGDSEKNTLTDLGKGRYILNFKADFGYTPTLMEFKQGELYIYDFDYDDEGKIFKKIKDQQKLELQGSNLTAIILHPTIREWEKISMKELFPSSKQYKKL